MLVNSIPFFIFFTIVFLPYFTLWKDKLRAQNLWLLLASYFFYGWVSWEMVFLLIGITIVFYFIGLAIPVRTSEKDSYNRSLGFMTIGVILGVGLLLYFKYLNFFIEQFVAFFGLLGMKTNFSSFNIVVPVGVSFFTFKLLSYVIEIYKGNIQPTKDFITFATYVAFFPTIMSGPIDRPADFMGQLTHCRKPEVEAFLDGCKRILWGMFLKMCIADKVSPYTDSVFDNYAHHSGLTIMVAAVLYSFQIYADFCGYSEMASWAFIGDQDNGQLLPSVVCFRYRGFLAEMAYQFDDVAQRLCLFLFGWKSVFFCQDFQEYNSNVFG